MQRPAHFSRRAASTACALALFASSALAQDGKGDDGKPAPPADATKADPAELLAKMERLYAVVVRPPDTALPPDAPTEAQVERTKRRQAWDDAVRSLAKTSDVYMAALAGAAPDARALYLRGVAKVLVSGLSEKSAAPQLREEAVDALRQFVKAAAVDDPFLADAELHLGQALVLSSEADPSRVDEAALELRKAVERFQKDGRHDDAGMAAWYAMSSLCAVGRDAEVKVFADAIHAADADFGRSTDTIRNYVAATRIAVGSPLPKIADAKDVDGNAVSFAPGDGPLLVHFFQTAEPGTGRATQFREVDSEIAPLWRRHHEKGLRVVGVCVDYAIPADEAEQKRAYWKDVVGRKEEFRDGSLTQAREWAAKNGVEWPWVWSGQWFKDPLAKAFGGVGTPSQELPFAVLVDKKGVVRWKGRAPFLDLPAAVAKLME